MDMSGFEPECLLPDNSPEALTQIATDYLADEEFNSDVHEKEYGDTDRNNSELEEDEEHGNEFPMDLSVRPHSSGSASAPDILVGTLESTLPPDVHIFNFNETQEEEMEFQDFGETEDAEPMCQTNDFLDESCPESDETFPSHVPLPKHTSYLKTPTKRKKIIKIKSKQLPEAPPLPRNIEENIILCNPFEFCVDDPDRDRDPDYDPDLDSDRDHDRDNVPDHDMELVSQDRDEQDEDCSQSEVFAPDDDLKSIEQIKIKPEPEDEEALSNIEENVILCNPFEFCVDDPTTYHDLDMNENKDEPDENSSKSEILDQKVLSEDNLRIKIKPEPEEMPTTIEENVILCNPFEFCVGDPGPADPKPIRIPMANPTPVVDPDPGEIKLNHCGACDRQFTNQVYFEIHTVRVHTGQKLYECEICLAKYNSPLHFIPHKKRHNPFFDESTTNMQDFIKYCCGHCKQIFPSMMSLGDHNLQAHDGKEPEVIEKPHICDICGKAFRKTQKLNDHVRIHTGEITHSCDICGKGFSRKDKLTLHMRTHTGEKPYTCEYCGKLYPYSSTLSRHIQMFHKEEAAAKKALEQILENPALPTSSGSGDPLGNSGSAHPWTCRICDRQFSTKATLKKHNTNVHTGETPYECDICHAKYKYFKSLGDHMKSHTGEKLYKCKVCAEIFYHWSTLKTHKETQHTGVTPHHCQHCHLSFATIANLDEHTNSKHKGEQTQLISDKPHKCPICGKGFMHSARLAEHSRIHTGDKSHSCELCGKSFLRKDALNAHKRVHTGEKPLHCEYCNMGFVRKATLNKHLLTHSKDDKPLNSILS